MNEVYTVTTVTYGTDGKRGAPCEIQYTSERDAVRAIRHAELSLNTLVVEYSVNTDRTGYIL